MLSVTIPAALWIGVLSENLVFNAEVNFSLSQNDRVVSRRKKLLSQGSPLRVSGACAMEISVSHVAHLVLRSVRIVGGAASVVAYAPVLALVYYVSELFFPTICVVIWNSMNDALSVSVSTVWKLCQRRRLVGFSERL